MILRGMALRQKNVEIKQNVDMFLQLLDSEWLMKISSTALRMLCDGQFNKAPVLPVTEDFIKLREFLLAEIPKRTEELMLKPEADTWRFLSEMTVARILTRNKRRGNEGAKVEITQFLDRPKWSQTSIEEMTPSLKPL